MRHNSQCLSLIEGKQHPLGILAMLSDECHLPEGSDKSFANKLHMSHGKNEKYEKVLTKGEVYFAVRHFAGRVEYDAEGFVEKNLDKTSNTLLSMARTSQISLVQKLFDRTDEEILQESKPKRGRSVQTIASQFSSQLEALVKSLKATTPHFIRCIKSNHSKAPGKLDGPLCLEQLKYAGLFEAIRIRKAGYGYRVPHSTFARRFAILGNNLLQLYHKGKLKDHEVCKRALEAATDSGFVRRERWRLGRTKVFLKDEMTKADLEEFRESKCHRKATKIAATFRMFKVRKDIFREKYLAAQREAKIKAENAKHGNAATALQTAFRAHFVRKRSRDLKLIVKLKIAMSRESFGEIEECLSDFECFGRISNLAEEVIHNAKVMLRRIKEKTRVMRVAVFAYVSTS